MKIKQYLGLSALPLNSNIGLLLFRIALPFLMVRYHGWGKLAGWANESTRSVNLFSLDGAIKEFHTFPNYIGISSELSYVLVAWLETFGAMAIVLGLFTRIQSLGLAFTMFVAFFFHHNGEFNGGETAFSYGFCYLLLFFTGAGKYSLDRKFGIGRS